MQDSDSLPIRFVPIVLLVLYLSAHVFICCVSVENSAFPNVMLRNNTKFKALKMAQRFSVIADYKDLSLMVHRGIGFKLCNNGLSCSVAHSRIKSIICA